MKTQNMIRVTIIMILVSFILTTLTSVNFLTKVLADNSEDVNTLLAARIYDTIKSDLYEPIMAGMTMSNDSFLKKALKQEEQISDEEMLSDMTEYLSTIRNNLDYSTAFVISDKSKKYYSYKGINRIIDTTEGAHDTWYSYFIDSGKKYNYNVDRDKVNNEEWTIFVNTRLEDENGGVLGICGVGMSVTDIQEIISDFEEEYDVKINLVDTSGVVQVDTDSVNIAQSVIEVAATKPAISDEYIYEKKDGGYVVTKYMEDFGWYLVIRNNSDASTLIFSSLIVKNIIVFAVILILLLISVRMILSHQKKKLEKSAVTDTLTGLSNRNYFDYRIKENPAVFMDMYKSIAIFDIDKFKNINDTMGHLKGDEILKQVANLAKETVGEKGKVIRWGGDEFLILFYGEKEESTEICDKLIKTIEKKTISTISVGVCSMQNSIESSFYKADEYLYKSKNKGRNQVSVCPE